MKTPHKIFSDPVHGFISIPRGLLMDLIQTPEVQRLRRIRQIGVGFKVFPAAEHTRFGHALGAMALMDDLLAHLRAKGTPINDEEHQAALIAALLHDLGHGPFSHTLEHELIADFHHEQMSRKLLVRLNKRFSGALNLAIEIFDNTYERPFFNQLVSSQLDVDRLDYLRRDSFYTGVVEGRIGVERLLQIMRVHPLDGGPDSQMVIEAKGIYAVENFLTSRRLMYWQVYLHRSVLAGDQILRGLIRRVRQLIEGGQQDKIPGGSPTFRFFLEQKHTSSALEEPGFVDTYLRLDDTDVIYSLKCWEASKDRVLADLCRRFLHRDFLRVAMLSSVPSKAQMHSWRDQVKAWLVEEMGLTTEEAKEAVPLYLSLDFAGHAAYNQEKGPILVVDSQGLLRELAETADTASVMAMTRLVVKPWLCFPKAVHLASLEALPIIT